jgi:hypothetical protein
MRHGDCTPSLVQHSQPHPFTTFGKRPFNVIERLPSEHGFWVMLAAAQAGALLRTRAVSPSVAVALLVSCVAVVAGSASHRQVRKSTAAQLIGTAALALSSVPIELAAAVLLPSIAWAALSRVVVFVASALVVRAAFAEAARGGARRGLLLRYASLALPTLSAALLVALGRTAEAGTCVIAGAVCAVCAWSRPTVKQLKPLGLALAGLALITAVTLAL